MEELSLNQISALANIIAKVTKQTGEMAWNIAKTMDMPTRNYLWAIFYEKKYDEFRRYINEYKPA